jgi:maltose alpha-D-glucosyltransferase/alpha-amylase
MPGTPVLYYGDEIGMGDNIYLGDRDGVRTPMQWSPDRNGGFSRSDPARLFLPAIQDPIYGFDSVNVEAQLRSPASLLNWMRRMIAIRRNHSAFGRGSLRFLYPANRKVLAYIRGDDDECILCVVNVSRSPQAVELDLSDFKGSVPVELTGGTAFPPIGELPYLLTLPSYGFYWFELSSTAVERYVPPPQTAPELFTLVLTGGPESIFKGRERTAFEREIMPRFIASRRWFAGHGARIRSVDLTDFATLRSGPGKEVFLLPLLKVEVGGEEQRYFAPLALDEREEEQFMPFAIARVRRGPRVGLLYGAGSSPEFALSLIDLLRRGDDVQTNEGNRLRFTATEALAEFADADPGEVKRLSAEQSNTSITVGEHMILKLYRRLQPGLHPEVEVGRFLTEVAGFKNTPALLGTVEYVSSGGVSTALAVLQRFVRNQGDAWSWSTETLKRELDTTALVQEDGEGNIETALANYRQTVETLARRTAELHLAFATPTDDPAFALEPLTREDVRTAADDARAQASRAFAAIDRLLPAASDTAREAMEALAQRRNECLALIVRLDREPVGAVKTRIHGDYHLGQVLIVQSDVMIVDFEGEPSRPAEERRAKSSPLRDVAGMLRSFAYLTDTAAREVGRRFVGEERNRIIEMAEVSHRFIESAFLAAYEEATRDTPVWVEDEETRRDLLRLHLLAKALYEINYEADHRPEWIETPVRGVLSILDQAGSTE